MVPFVFEGALNGELFKENTSLCPAPTQKAKDIVVMDKFGSHKVNGVIDPIIAAGATVRYLPSYSPALNPIEMMRPFLRKMEAGTGKTLEMAIADVHRHITIANIRGWFEDDGYSTY